MSWQRERKETQVSRLILEIVLCAVLLTAIVFFWRVSQRLDSVQKIGGTLSPFLKMMSQFVQNISQSLRELKNIVAMNEDTLTEKIPKATELRDDLEVLLEHGEKLAKRLDHILGEAQHVERSLKEIFDRNDSYFQKKESKNALSRLDIYDDRPERSVKPSSGFAESLKTLKADSRLMEFLDESTGLTKNELQNSKKEVGLNATDHNKKILSLFAKIKGIR